MIETLIEFLSGIFPVGLPGRGRAAFKAYKSAWKTKESSGEEGVGVLIAELKKFSVPGAYGPTDSDKVSFLFDAWRNQVSPRKLRRFERAHSPK